MGSREESKIPRPPALRTLTTNEVETSQETTVSAGMNRKRKGISPAKPEAKRPAAANSRGRPAPAAKPSARGVAPSKASATPAAGSAEEQTWQQVSEELGWTPADCLSHRLVFKKKEDAKVLKETLLQYIRRLRALGKHLQGESERQEMALDELQGTLEAERTARQQEAQGLQDTIGRFETSTVQLQGQLSEVTAQLQQKSDDCSQLQSKLTAEEANSAAAGQQSLVLAAEQRRLQEQLEDVKKQVANITEMHQHAQKYNSQLQEYNTKLQTDIHATSTKLRELQEEKSVWTEETASLRGGIAALESQLAAAQSASVAADEARQLALSDVHRLRGEVDQKTKQRDENQQCLVDLQKELTRYKDCTGKSVENLEKEKASKALLQSQNKAQVEFNSELRDEVAKLQAQLAMAQASADRQAAKAADTEIVRRETEAALQAAEHRVREGEIIRRKLHNTILELKGNIRVFCRVRPLSQDNLATEAVDGKPLIQLTTSGECEGQGLELSVTGAAGQPANHKFSFDRVFGPASQQEDVFEEISQLVQSALDGYKVCIFAYGQTGSGKTYTMVGPAAVEHRGVIPRAVQQLFDASRKMEEQGWTFEMKASMMEIYNEELRDLLGKGPPSGKKHQITHDDKGTTAVSFMEAVDCKRPERVRDLLAKATRMRSVGATAANEQSSRSHMVFSMSIVGGNESSGQQINGVLNLIDLAGSERLSKSLATGDRLKETQAINKSLSALGDVIMALGNKESHVPFRNSKLTYLLQPCLGGDAKTLMFVNVAPTLDAANESLCSLRFAAKVNATEIGTARRNIAIKP